MPKVQVTTRYLAVGDGDQSYFSQLKRKERQRVLSDYPSASELTQSVITDGIPDAVRFGDLRSKGQVAIRTEFILSQELVDKMKKDKRL